MKKDKTPVYTKKEELFHAITHIVGGGIGVIVLILGIVFGVKANINGLGIFSIVLYGTSMILLYTMSSLYHFLPKSKAKHVFRIFDHCTIYLLIAGTYSPICLIALKDSTWGIVLFIIVWFAALVGITLNAINMYQKSIKIISMILYLAMGWSVVIALFPLLDVLHYMAFVLLLIGGLFYTTGVAFYINVKKRKYYHGIWHLFCLAGTVIHFIAIFVYIINV